MAYYQGSEVSSKLIDTLIQKLTSIPEGAIEPFWKSIQSGSYADEGFVLRSKGSSGKDNIIIRIKGILNYVGLTVSILEGYTPNPVQGLVGVVTNEIPIAVQYTTSSTYGSNIPVNYWLSFDKDKIMLLVAGSINISSTYKNFVWAGMPERLSEESDSTAVTLAVSNFSHTLADAASTTNGFSGIVKMLRNRKQEISQKVHQKSMMISVKNIGWGDCFILPDIFLEHGSDEGVRAKLPGVSPVSGIINVDFKDLDEVTVGSRRFVIHKTNNVSGNNMSSFLSDYLAIEKL
ncbi:hypothetical protein ACK8P5_25590 (plasmid) [Paenibacillus sp. EC2-1]|uniref:hypothetical protein n=1 Tax=Paenibacillus sp. EC2-1 TaxID=3388665 RepID=UPI003BEF3999